ncbi:MAG: extracellular solute-binding protein [Candidatus Gracilibacteria bacterium]|jgi:ABC-type glycerol-3-phosphate transport system substrate-binding protein|nr:extracellular solute-binding protein [Candidatus Gracilibacteria bacterium]
MAKNKMKKITSILLILILTLSLTSCRTKKKPTAGEGQEKGAQVEKIELVWWSLFDPCDTYKGQIQQFQTENKNIRIRCKKFSNPEEYEKILINEIAEGEGPDIFSLKNTKITQHKKKISPIPSSMVAPEQFRDIFFAVAADDLILEDEKKVPQIYGIPLYIDTLAIYYNKQLFRDNLPTTDKPATTWEELKEQVYGLTKRDNSVERFNVSGIAMGRADNISRAIDILSMLLIQYDTEMYKDSNPPKSIFGLQQGTIEGTGKAYYPGKEALSLYTSFALSSYKHNSWNSWITATAGDQKEVGAFVKGKVAMVFGYSWLYEELKLQVQAAQKQGKDHIKLEDIGIAAVPQVIDPTESGRQDALASYYPLTVSKNSEHPEKAWDFITFLTTPDSLQDYHEKTHKPSPRKDMFEEQSIERLFGVFARQASYAKSIKTIDDDTFIKIFEDAINSVAKSKADTKGALRIAQKRMDCVLKRKIDPTIDTKCEDLD